MPDATASPLHGTSGDLRHHSSNARRCDSAGSHRRTPERNNTSESAPRACAASCSSRGPSGPRWPRRALPRARGARPGSHALLFGRMVDATADTGGRADARLRRYSAACAELALVVGVSLFFTAGAPARLQLGGREGRRAAARAGFFFGRMLAQETAWFDKRETGDLLSRLASVRAGAPRRRPRRPCPSRSGRRSPRSCPSRSCF